MNLEFTLAQIPLERGKQLKHEILDRVQYDRINPVADFYQKNDRYLKDDIPHRTKVFLEERDIQVNRNFINNFYDLINKEPMKRVYYGLLSGKNIPSEVPRAVKECFEDLGEHAGFNALAYFYDGVWHIWNGRDIRGLDILKDSIFDLYDITSILIYSGIEGIKRLHNKFVEKGLYKEKLEKVPFENEIVAQLPSTIHLKNRIEFVKLDNKLKDSLIFYETLRKETIRNFAPLVEAYKENTNYENTERLAIFLDSCNSVELGLIEEVLGKEILGGYALAA